MSKEKTVDKVIDASRFYLREALRSAGYTDDATIDSVLAAYNVVVQDEYKYLLREV